MSPGGLFPRLNSFSSYLMAAGPGLLVAVPPRECRDGTLTAVETGFSKNIRIIWQGSIPDISIAPFKKPVFSPVESVVLFLPASQVCTVLSWAAGMHGCIAFPLVVDNVKYPED